MGIHYEPRAPQTIADPIPVMRRLQEEEPLHWSASLGGWVVTRYDDCRMVISDKRFSAARMRPFFEHLSPEKRARVKELEWSVGLWAVFLDPPDHTRLRKLMNGAFTSRAVESMQGRIAAITNELLDAVVERGRMDFMADFAYPLPATVVMEMLGVPRSALPNFKIWSDDLALFVGSSLMTPEKYDRAEAATHAMSEYFRSLLDERRRQPQDDLLTALAQARDAGDMLSDEELVASCILLLFAGHETTANLLANGMYLLLKNPDELARLRREPGLIESAVEEMLRCEGPSASLVRVAHEDVELHGQTITKGQRVFTMLNAANRDPRHFPDPDRFDVGRKQNRNITFGFGIHFCLGAPLARLEGRIALPIVLDRLQELRLLEEPGWIDSLILRGVHGLEIGFRPGPRLAP